MKLLCVRCKCEPVIETSGATAIEYASFGVYKVWDADVFKCPGCGVEIAVFADAPLRRDTDSPDFPTWLEKIKRFACRIVEDYEHPQRG